VLFSLAFELADVVLFLSVNSGTKKGRETKVVEGAAPFTIFIR
jgi:hypothetical protein